MGEAHARHSGVPWWLYKEVLVSSGTIRVVLASCLQERIKTVANANMENLHDQRRTSPQYQKKGACPVQSRQMEMGGGGEWDTITLCKHLIGSYAREGEKLL